MANNRIQFKRTSTSGLLPNTTNSANASYIAAGEIAVNLTDKRVIASDGSTTFEVGANVTNQNVTNNLNLTTNGAKITFVANGSASGNQSYFTLQTDNNFVFYNSATDGTPRAIWASFTNSNTSALNLVAPIKVSSALQDATGSNGTNGQVLTSNGTATLWTTAAGGSFSNGTAYTWSAPQTYTANIALTSNTTSIMFAGAADNNWKIGRSIATYTKAYYTNNSLDFLIGSSALEGISFGNIANTSFLEMGSAGNWFRSNVAIGNVAWSAMLTVGGSANISGNVVVGTASTNNQMQILSNSQINPSGTVTSNAYLVMSGAGANYLAFGQTPAFSQWVQAGFNGGNTYYPIIMNPLGGNVYVGSLTNPASTFSVNGTVTFANSSANTLNIYANGQILAPVFTGNVTGTASNASALGSVSLATLQNQITGNAATAYTNAVAAAATDASTKAGTAYTNAITYSSNASTLTSGTVAEARLPYRMNQNVKTSDSVEFVNITVSGNITVTGTQTVLGGNTLSITDNMIYMNQGVSATITNVSGNGSVVTFTANNNYSAGWDVSVISVNPTSYNGTYLNILAANATHFQVSNTNTASYVSGGSARGKTESNPDLGFAFGYNDGTYHHGGFFRDATDGVFKVFDNYDPEPDTSVFIDTSNSTFRIANFQANTVYLGNTSVFGSINGTSYSGTSNNATNFGGSSLATIQGQITGNAATAYTNAVAVAATDASTKAGTAYSNAVAVAANATNLASGTVAFARLPNLFIGTTAVQSTSAAQALSGITTLAAGNTTITGFANVTSTLQVGGVATFSANANFDSGVLFVDGTNNRVGIDTTSPSYKLDVFGGDIRLANNATYIRSVTSNGTTVRMLGINAANDAYVGPIDPGPISSIFNASNTSGIAAFYTSGTEKMRITTTGNVGIGTTAPTSRLAVDGNFNVLSGNATLSNGALIVSNTGSGSATITISTANSSANGGVGTEFLKARIYSAQDMALVTGQRLYFRGAGAAWSTPFSFTTDSPFNQVAAAGDHVVITTTDARSNSSSNGLLSGILSSYNLNTPVGASANLIAVSYRSSLAETSWTGTSNNAMHFGAWSGATLVYRVNKVGDVYAAGSAALGNTTITGFANVANTLQVSGITTFSANVVLGSSGLSANGGFGTAGQVLHSNGSATYWASDDNSGGTVTSIATANGLSGGTITTSGTLGVTTGSTLTVNTNGIHVNSALSISSFAVGNSFVANSTGIRISSNSTFIQDLSAGTGYITGVLGYSPEAGITSHPFLTNDLANGRLRGMLLGANTNVTLSNSNFDTMFDATPTVVSGFANTTANTVLEFTNLPNTLQYGSFIGISFGSGAWAPTSLTIEALSNGAWVSCYSNTFIPAYTLSQLQVPIPGNAGNGTTAIKFTMGANTSTRIDHIWAYDYASDGWSHAAMPRSGGAFYGNVILGSVGLSANGGFGTAGQVLHSNGSATYWAADDDTNTTYDLLAVANTAVNAGILRLKDSSNSNDNVTFTGAGTSNVSSNASHIIISSADQYLGTVTSIATANGLTGGTITSTGTLGVVAGNTLTVNTTGIHVNSALSLTSLALSGDLTVSGNLTVSGTRTYVNTTTLDVGDNIVTLNADLGANPPTQDAGMEIMRGTSANVQFLWDETNDRWTTNGQPLAISSLVATGAASGITTLAAGNTTITGFVNVTSTAQIGNSTVFTSANSTAVTTTNVIVKTGAQPGNFITSAATGNDLLNIRGGNYTHAVNLFDSFPGTNATAYASISGGYQNQALLRLSGFNASNVNNLTATYGSDYASIANAAFVANSTGITTTGFANVATTLQVGGVATFGANANFDSGVLFVDGTNNRVGIGTTTPATRLHAYVVPANNSTVDDVLRLTSKFESVNNAASAANGSGPAIVFSGGIGDNQTRDRGRIVAVYEGLNVSGLAFHTQDTADIITEKVRIQAATGNMGIGNTTPAHKLSVNGTVAAGNTTLTGFANITSTLQVGGVATFGANANFDSGVLFVDGTNNRVGVGTLTPSVKLDVVGLDGDGLQYRTSTRTIGIGSVGGVNALYGGSGTELTFHIGSERMRISNTGNVGIGTTAPNTILDLNNTYYNGTPSTLAQLINKIALWSSGATPTYGIGISTGALNITAGEAAGIVSIYTGGSSERMRVAANGNVGIGNTTPADKLSVTGAINFTSSLKFGGVSVIDNAGTDVYINSRVIRNNSSSMQDGMYIGYNNTGTTAGHLRFYAGGTTERMRIDAGNGNIGIATTSPGAKLDVVGMVRTSDQFQSNGGGRDLRMNDNFGSSVAAVGVVSNNPLMLFTNNTERMRVAANGNFGIGTTTPNATLEVNGSAVVNTISVGTATTGKLYSLTAGGQGANNTTYELCRISRDTVNWSTQYLEVTIYNQYYRGGKTRWIINYNQVDAGTAYCVEAAGTQMHKLYLGTEVLVSGTINYIPVLIDLPQYTVATIDVRYRSTEVATISNASQLQWVNTYTTNASATAFWGGNIHLAPTSGANVGIGTTSPGSKLTVAGTVGLGNTTITGSANVSTTLQVGGTVAAGNTTLTGFANVSTTLQVGGVATFGANANFDSGVLFVDGVNNRVGIGTTTPGSRLDVVGNTTAIALNFGSTVPNNPLFVGTYGNYSGIGMDQSTAGLRLVGDYTGNNPIVDMGYYTSGTVSHANWVNRVRVSANGNVGIGTTSPQQPFVVSNAGAGGIEILPTGVIQSYNRSTSAYQALNIDASVHAFRTGTTERVRIDGSGNVGIGTTGPQSKLQIFGSAAPLTGDAASVETILTLTREGSASVWREGASFALGRWQTGGGSNPFSRLDINLKSVTDNSSLPNVTVMTLQDNGFVGIGTTTPTTMLTVRPTFQFGDPEVGNINIYGITSGGTSSNPTSAGGIVFGDQSATNSYMGRIAVIQNNPSASTSSHMRFYTNGGGGNGACAERMRIDASGNVGIGTTSPGARLETYQSSGGTNAIRMNTNFASGNYVDLNPSISGVSNGGYSVSLNGTIYQVISASGNFGIGTTTPQYELDVNNGNATNFQASFGSPISTGVWSGIHFGYSESANQNYRKSAIVFEREDGSARGKIHILNDGAADGGSATLTDSKLTIQYDGKVGIGTTAPGTMLDIGSTQGAGITMRYDSNTTYRALITPYWNSSTDTRIDFAINNTGGATPTVYMSVGYNGNVGVGTITPANKLHVVGSAGTLLRLDGGSGGTGTRDIFISEFDTTAYGGIIRYDSAADLFTFGTVENSVVVNAINVTRTSGNVGIGTTAPGAYKLNVNGQSYFADTMTFGSGGYISWTSGYSDGTTQTFASPTSGSLALITNGTTGLFIKSNQNVGIGTTTPGYKLEVNGSFAATTKSFVIDHPTKPDMKLRYGSLEGPENGVYVRGRLKAGETIIHLPDYWEGLVDQDTYTVNLTPVGKHQELFVEHIADDYIVVGGENIDCFYTVFAERKDVEKLVVEF
jgi:hypothetical protein